MSKETDTSKKTDTSEVSIIAKLICWVKSHIWLSILITFSAFIIPLVIVHLLYKWVTPIYILQSDWDSGDLLTYIAGFEAFLGSVILAAFAIHANNRANYLNELFLKNEARRDLFERKPKIFVMSFLSSLLKKFDGFSATKGAYFDVPENAPNGISRDSYLLQLHMKLVNASSSFASITISKIVIKQDGVEKCNLEYFANLSGLYPNEFYIAPYAEQDVYILIPPTIYPENESQCFIHLTLHNSINETFYESIMLLMIGDNAKTIRLLQSSTSLPN